VTESNAEVRHASGVTPQGLRIEELAQILSALGPKPVAVAMLEEDIAAGAPTNSDGTLNLIRYVAWLIRENARAGS
jgi:hypothetical protein